MDYQYYQIGGAKCSLCGSDGTNKTTCPLNPAATNKNWAKHPLAGKAPVHAAAPAAPAPKPPAPAPKPPAPAPAPKPPAPAPKPPAPAPAPKPVVPIKAAIKPVRIQISPPFKRSECKNSGTILGDNIEDLETNKFLYVTKSGHCFNIETELLPSFQSGNFKNPYTNQLFEEDELKDMLKYPHIKDTNRTLLKDKLAAGLSQKTIDVIVNYPEVFKNIYRAGYACFIDYTDMYKYSPDEQFFYALEGIRELSDSIGTLPPTERQIVLDMKTGRETLEEMLTGINGNCIHGGGIKLLKVFMQQYHLLPDKFKPDVSDLGIVNMQFDPDVSEEAQKNAYVLCFNTINSHYRLNFTLVYIYDEPTSGRNDYMSYFMDIYGNGGTSFGHRHPPTNPWQLAIWLSMENKYGANDGGFVLNIIAQTLPKLNYTRPLRR